MLTNNLGFPRVGPQRELKKACEQYWADKITKVQLYDAATKVEEECWKTQLGANIDLIPVGDFSLYDHVLDMALLVGAIPDRYSELLQTVNKQTDPNVDEIDLYFAMARGYQKGTFDVTPMEMTKWFDTNYHYIVPEFKANQQFKLFSKSLFSKFTRAKSLFRDATPKPVLIGPVSFLLLGKEKEEGFHRLDLLEKLLPVYCEILIQLNNIGAEWVQLDEPYLALDLTDREKQAFQRAYHEYHLRIPQLKVLIATYFEGLGDNSELALSLPVAAIHLDLARSPEQLETILKYERGRESRRMALSLGVIDGRNVWKNNYKTSCEMIRKAISVVGKDRIIISPSCSLLHVPFDLDFETGIRQEIKTWLAFAKQKLHEISDIYEIIQGNGSTLLLNNQNSVLSRTQSEVVHNKNVKSRLSSITTEDSQRKSPFSERQGIQRRRFCLPSFPTTTIGSFPQTSNIRQLRAKLKNGDITKEEYETSIEKAIIDVIRWQENVGLDVLVHGEFERNDMVEYFGELLEGFLFTRNGWVTSYGSRCVKPPIIYGDVSRVSDMTVRWSKFAQSETTKLMKGMITGPVTILQWSFVRDDQPRWDTAFQIALAMRDEVIALQNNGLKVIQIDEPAMREGLPLRHKDWERYLEWAVKAFKITSCGVNDETQIHTHMCYSEFNDIIENIASMDADVITVENSRSQMELLQAFSHFNYPNEIGPGIYDIHSPRVPSVDEMFHLLQQTSRLINPSSIWVNPDCGLKTRSWDEVKKSLTNMVEAAHRARVRLITN